MPEGGESAERLDEVEAVKRLNAALSRQYRSPLQYSIVASSLVGLEALGLGWRGADRLRRPGAEHMLEHQIMRKQRQADFLQRALGS